MASPNWKAVRDIFSPKHVILQEESFCSLHQQAIMFIARVEVMVSFPR